MNANAGGDIPAAAPGWDQLAVAAGGDYSADLPEIRISRSNARLGLPEPDTSSGPFHRSGDKQRSSQDPPVATGHKFLTEDLNVWTGPGEQFSLKTVLSIGSRVEVTGSVKGVWAEIVYEGKASWLRSVYLSENKPVEETTPSDEVTEAPCRLGDSVEVGLTPDAIRVYRSVCAAFPEVTSYGGVRPDGGEHSEGRALDIMVLSPTLGDEISEWVRANSESLGASEVLWAQHIWTVERDSEGWRLFEDRGSPTANHYDHVHVTVYGDSGA